MCTMYLSLLLAILPVLFAAPAEDYLQEFANGNHKVVSDVYKSIIKSQKDSLVVSPLSAEIILALTAEGAEGAAETELIDTLYLPDTKEKIETLFKSFLPTLHQSTDNLKVLSANKLYVANGHQLQAHFQEVAVDAFDAEADNIDFSDPEGAADIINQYVEDHTNNKIQKFIDPDTLSADLSLVLVNTLYFSGQWETPFLEYRTAKKPFYKSVEEYEEIDIMESEDYATYNYGYSENLKAKYLQLNYEDSTIAMFIILPDEVEGLADVEVQLEDYLELPELELTNVRLRLPKFSTTTKLDLKPVLQDIGIKKIFNAKETEITDIVEGENLFVDFILQKTYISIGENGTEAASASAGGADPTEVHDPLIEFNAFHPFFYIIEDTVSGIILFAGKFTI